MTYKLNHYQVQQFSKLELLASQVVEGFITGMHQSPFHGFSVEFAEHRPYNQGESTNDIDWKLFARTDKLFVKRFEEETNLRCQLVIDASSSMYYPFEYDLAKQKHNKLSFSVFAAAALIYLLKNQRDATGLSIYSDKLELHTSARNNPVHHKFLFHELEKLLTPIDISTQKQTNTPEILHLIAESIHKRSLVIIFSDLIGSNINLKELFSALQHLKHAKHEVILFNVSDKNREMDFNFKNQSYKFIDLESGQELKLKPYLIKEEYIKAFKKYHELIRLTCLQYKIDLADIDINEGFVPLMQKYLIKRKKLF